MPIRVRVERDGALEAEHLVEGAVVDAAGRLRAATERPDLVTFFRSASKPFQLLPLVERGHAAALGLGERHLAVASASHNAEPAHLGAVREILAAVGRGEEDLECGFHLPDLPAVAERVRALPAAAHTGVWNNCSGKHAAMVALAVREGWPVAGYTALDHPVQRGAIAAIADVCGVDAARLPVGIDGCSAANPALPLLAMARGFARFAAARADAAEPRTRALALIRDAMAAQPFLVAGSGRFCNALMEVTGGRLVTKTGAEGVQCVAIPSLGLGVAVKARDGGARRAVGPALVGWLAALGLLAAAEVEALAAHAHPAVTNHRGLLVGAIHAVEFPDWRGERPAPAPAAGAALTAGGALQ
jgi:L-asparaginase II